MEPTVIYLVDRRRKLLNKYEAVQQGAAAVVLITAGYDRLQSAPETPSVFSAALIAAGVLLLLVAARELRGHESKHVGVLNLVAGVALLTEWGVSVADGGKLFRPSLVMGLLSLGLGLFHARVQRGRKNRRTLRMDADGLAFWLNPFRRFRVRWVELAWISVQPTEIRLRRLSGRQHRIPLRRLENAPEVSAAVLAASRDAGVESRIPEAAAT